MPQQAVPRKPEIMSPAGYWPQLRAAIEAGADAVYLGLKHFTARAKVGFALSELREVMETLHKRGVRGYITFNTLAFENELREAGETIEAIASAGADALIIQDLGILQLAREIAPDIELHASTQMSITDAAGVRLAQSLGVQRVTLARELSLKEVGKIIAETGCDIEIFVHGALCVAYSGQCFSSEAWGGRSANRGQCAQACRLPYEMIVDGQHTPLGDARYLLSPGDLYALEQVPEIVQMGVAALKIEGRYKDAEYVALTTHAYRTAVDNAWENRSVAADPRQKLQLEQVYSRGLGPYFISGTDHQKVVRGRAPRHRGVYMGAVTHVLPDAIVVEASEANGLSPLKAGDGVVFDAASRRSPQEPEEGGRVYQVLPRLDGRIEIRFANNAIRFDRVRAGDLLWRTHDPEIERAARPFTEASGPVHKQAVDVRVTARAGETLQLEWRMAKRPEVRVLVSSPHVLAVSQKQAASLEGIRDQLSRLGNTPYELGQLNVDLSGRPFIPVSLLNQLRRQAVDELQSMQARIEPYRTNAAGPVLAQNLSAAVADVPVEIDAKPKLHVLVRTPEQLEAALELRPASITLDYLDLYGLRPSVERVKASGLAVRVASPRILKPGEARIANFLLSLDCPLLVRSGGLLEALRAKPHRALTGDFSLNAANTLTAHTLLELGLAKVTPTHDLNAEQVAELARQIGAQYVEAVAYQHLPVFHTEHCVFCRFLSSGTSFVDCGRPCEKHRVSLRDENGRAHPVMADVGCRNTVFGAEAQEASRHLESWMEAGIRDYRLEFVHESGKQLRRVVQAFEAVFNGRIEFSELGQELRRAAPEGTTQGSLFVPESAHLLPVLQ